jgi:hypothetical protein
MIHESSNCELLRSTSFADAVSHFYCFYNLIYVAICTGSHYAEDIYLEEDGITAHQHKFKEASAFLRTEQTQSDTTADTIISLLKNIDQKLDVLLKERESENNILDN